MNKRWKTNNKTIYNISYHLIWCPKYRKDVLVGHVEKRLKEILIEKSTELDIEIVTMEVMPDHVHIFVKAKPCDSPQQIVAYLKGYSSNVLRKEFCHLKSKLPCLWSRSYYCESIGHISEETIKKYIEDQKQ